MFSNKKSTTNSQIGDCECILEVKGDTGCDEQKLYEGKNRQPGEERLSNGEVDRRQGKRQESVAKGGTLF